MNPSPDTKARILEVAERLFSAKGFGETSVRDIANEAGVNVAAINYHFQNKQLLFWEVFRSGILDLESNIADLHASKQFSVEDLSWEIYKIMSANHLQMHNIFRMILSPNLPEADPTYNDFCQSRHGPPGADSIAAALTREYGSDLPAEGIFWAVKSIFTFVVHWALITSTAYMKEFAKHEKSFTDPALMEMSVKNHTEAVCKFLVENPDRWQAK